MSVVIQQHGKDHCRHMRCQKRRKIGKIGGCVRGPQSRRTFENGYSVILLWGSRGRTNIGLNHAILAPFCKISAKCWGAKPYSRPPLQILGEEGPSPDPIPLVPTPLDVCGVLYHSGFNISDGGSNYRFRF